MTDKTKWWLKSHYGDSWPQTGNATILESIDRTGADNRHLKGKALAELLESKLKTATARLEEVQRALAFGEITDETALDQAISIGNWLKASGVI